jgi:hypothetical protein
MEHKGKKDDFGDYLNDQGQGDFDNFLKEKLKGWTSPTESTILQDQKLLPTRGKLPPAESVEADSSNTLNSNVTDATEASSEPSNVEPVAESSKDEAPEAVSTEVVPTEKELESNPDFTRQILDGKTATSRTSLVSVHGIKSGPWAKQNIAEEALPGDVVLEKLGLPDYASLWKTSRNFYVRTCEKDVDKLIKHINRLEIAAFRVNLMKEAGKDYLKTLLEGMSQEERKRAETLVSKLYREKSDRSKAGAPTVKRDKPTGEPKVKTLSAASRKSYDTMIVALGATYEQMVKLVMAKPPADVDLVLAYIKEKFGK